MVPALGKKFGRWVLDLPWSNRFKPSSCLVKRRIKFLTYSSNFSWMRFHVSHSLLKLSPLARKIGLVSTFAITHLDFSSCIILLSVFYFSDRVKSWDTIFRNWLRFRWIKMIIFNAVFNAVWSKTLFTKTEDRINENKSDINRCNLKRPKNLFCYGLYTLG